MTICSHSTGNITLGLRPREILPASREQIVMLPSHKGNNCILCIKISIHTFLSTNKEHAYIQNQYEQMSIIVWADI